MRSPPNPLTAEINPGHSSFDPLAIAQIVGTHGTLSNGVYKIVIGRKATLADHAIGKEMGVNTWAAFAGSEERAVSTETSQCWKAKYKTY
jgi:hypothetical protein